MAKSQPDCCSQCREIKSDAEKAKAKLNEMKKHMDAFKTLSNKKTTAAYNSMVEVLVQNLEDILEGDTNNDTVKPIDVNKELQEKTTTPTRNLKRKLPLALAKTNKDGSTRSKVLKNTPSSNNKKYLLKSSGGITTVKRPAAMVRVSGRARRTSYKDFILTNGAAKKQKSNSNKKNFTTKQNKNKDDTEVSEDEDEFTFENSLDQSNLSRSRRVITPNKKYSSYWLNPSIKKQKHQNDSSTFFEKNGQSSVKEENIKRGRGRPRKQFSDTKPTSNKYIKQESGLSDSERTIRIKSEPKSPPVVGNSRSPKIPVSQSNEIKVIKLTNSSQELNKFDLDSDSPELVVFVRSKRVSPSSQKHL